MRAISSTGSTFDPSRKPWRTVASGRGWAPSAPNSVPPKWRMSWGSPGAKMPTRASGSPSAATVPSGATDTDRAPGGTIIGACPSSSSGWPSPLTTCPSAEGVKLPARVSRLPCGVATMKNPSPSRPRSQVPPVPDSEPGRRSTSRPRAFAIDSVSPAWSSEVMCSENTTPSRRKPVVSALATLLATARISRIRPDWRVRLA